MRAAGLAACGLAWLAIACTKSDPARNGAAQDRELYRRAHRAYDGAPPTIPHAVTALARQDCLGCHREGMGFGDDGLAPSAPHAERVSCQQCHVEQVDAKALFEGNSFRGLRYPASGSRAYPGAPPTMPHPRSGRESCLGCHGDAGGSPIRTPHPDRVNCLQCHVEQDQSEPLFGENRSGGARE